MKTHLGKQVGWKKMTIKVNKITDRLGMPVDKDIKETVIVINLLGFKTSGSCEGHMDHGVAGPWVDIDPKDFIDLSTQIANALSKAEEAEKAKKSDAVVNKLFKNYHSLISKEVQPVLEEARKFTSYLKEFYSSHKTSYDRMLIIRTMYRFFRIESLGVFLQDIADPKTKQQKLGGYQEEMNLFTNFLKDKFFSSSSK